MSTPAQSISASDFQKMLQNESVILLDVRTPEEFSGEKIKGSLNIDALDPGFETRVAKLDKSKTYLIYCRVGRRSARALNTMKQKGIGKVYHLSGGITDWKAKGFDTER
jgi:rhodanese-related sulfurtransferase